MKKNSHQKPSVRNSRPISPKNICCLVRRSLIDKNRMPNFNVCLRMVMKRTGRRRPSSSWIRNALCVQDVAEENSLHPRETHTESCSQQSANITIHVGSPYLVKKACKACTTCCRRGQRSSAKVCKLPPKPEPEIQP